MAWLIRVQVLAGMLLDALEAAPTADADLDDAERGRLLGALSALKQDADERLAAVAPEAEAAS